MLSWILGEKRRFWRVQEGFMEFLLSQPLGKGRDEVPSLLPAVQGHWVARLDGESLHWEGKFGDDNRWLGAPGPPGEVLKEALAGPSWHDSSRPVDEGWGDHGPSWSLEAQLASCGPLCQEHISCSAWNALYIPLPGKHLPCFFLFFFLATPCGLWDLSSLTRDQTRAPCSESEES